MASRAIRAPRVSLRTKLTLLATLLVGIPVPAVGAVLVVQARAALTAQAKELQLAIADDVAGSLERELGRGQDGLDAVGRLLMDDGTAEDAAVAAAIRTVEGTDALDHVAVYDREGALVDVIHEVDSGHPRAPEVLAPALRAEAAADGFALGAVSAGDVGARVLVVVPLRAQPAASPHGFAASSVSLEAFQTRVEGLVERRLGAAEGSIVVADRALTTVAAAGRHRGRHPLLGDVARATFRERFAEQRVFERDGEAYLGTLMSVPGRGWVVAVDVPGRVAFAPIGRMQAVVVSTASLVTILALAIGLWTSRSLTRPIAALVELAGKLGRRELGATVEVETTDELRTLGDAMSAASLNLEESEARVRQEEAIRADLGRYLPAEIVERVVTREQSMELGGERRVVSVLFADVVRFTQITEEHDPERVVGVLNELFTILTEIVFRHGGTVDKFIGDSVMAIWNAPADQPDHAERAVRAAMEMHSWLEVGNAAWRERHGIDVRLAIGVNTGEAIVGNVGSETRMAYTAIGDVVNLAARLEAIARPQQTLVTKATRDGAADAFEYVDAGQRRLAGRREPVHLFEVHA